MLNTLFRRIFDTDMTSVIALSDFLICVGSALLIGIILAGSYMWKTRYTKSFVITLAMLPAIVCVVIMMVNGNVGAGVAVERSVWSVSVLFLALQRRLAQSSLPWEPDLWWEWAILDTHFWYQ